MRVRLIAAGIAVLAALGPIGCALMAPQLVAENPLRVPSADFETVWKAIWLVAIAWPLWSAHPIDADTAETVKACLMGVVIFPLAIPWPYVIANFVRKPADRWK